MATSQNGWTVHEDQTNLVTLGYVTGRVRGGAVHAVLNDLCGWFDRNIEPIRRTDSWGWAYRPIRGKTNGYSNHSSGTAIDLNATTHPLGKWNTFSPDQRAKIRAKLREYEGAVRWGGDYQNRPDDMHFEINVDAATLARVAKKLGGASPIKPSTGGTTTKPSTTNPSTTPKHNTESEEDIMAGISRDDLTAIIRAEVKAALISVLEDKGRYTEYVDEDAKGRNTRSIVDVIYAGHANAVGANQKAAKIAKKVGA